MLIFQIGVTYKELSTKGARKWAELSLLSRKPEYLCLSWLGMSGFPGLRRYSLHTRLSAEWGQECSR